MQGATNKRQRVTRLEFIMCVLALGGAVFYFARWYVVICPQFAQ